MTAVHDIDLPAVLADRLTTAHPEVLRELLATFIHALMGAEADALCGTQCRADQFPQRVPAAPIRHPRRHFGVGDSQAASGLVLPGLAAGASQAGRAGADHGGCHQRRPCRRAGVVGIFPDRNSLIHLVGAVLAEQHDELAESRRHLSLDVLSKSRAIIDTPTEQKATPAALIA